MSQVSPLLGSKAHPPDRRAHARQPVRSIAYVELGDGNGGIALNVGEGGLAIQAVMSLSGDDLPAIRIQLAHSRKQIHTKGRVAWTADLRKLAGVKFVDPSEETRAQIREWVSLESPDPDIWRALAEPDIESALSPAATKPNAPPVELPVAPEGLEADQPPIPQPRPKPPGLAEPRPRPRPRPAPEVAAAFVPEPFQNLSAPSETRSPAQSSTTASADETVRQRPVGTEPVLVAESSYSSVRREAAALPSDRFGFRTAAELDPVRASDRDDFDKPSVSRWVAVFVLVSLGAGWFAGRAGWRSVVERISGNPANSSVAAENSAEPMPANSPNDADIEVLDLNNHRWMIPIVGPTEPSSTPTVSTPAVTSASAQNLAGSRQWTLPAASQNSVAVKAAPAVLSPASSEPVKALPAISNEPREASPVALPQASTTSANGLQPGELLRKVEPVYPPAALAQKVEGTVKIVAVIDGEGNVKMAQPLSGPRMLIPAAVEAVRQWRYRPTLLRGQPIETQREITVSFQLATAAPATP